MKFALIFTRGMSLQSWVDIGLFEREKLIYEEHLSCGNWRSVYWFTYGKKDEGFANQLKKKGFLHPDINVRSMPLFFWGKLGILLYSFFMPFFHWRVFKEIDLFKTNQMDGAWTALLASKIFSRPIYVRTGYTMTCFLRSSGQTGLKLKVFSFLERLLFSYAPIASVSSQHDKAYLESEYLLAKNRIYVIPNYIDIDNFSAFNPIVNRTERVIFVGRLSEQKNLFNLVDAVAQLRLRLDIYGDGDLKGELLAKVNRMSVDVKFMGRIANDKLPDILNTYRYFAIVSFYEGMPKALLEAMSCGCLCVGTDVAGINEVIADGRNGILAIDTDSKSLVEALQRIKKCNHENMSSEAVASIRKTFSLSAVCEQEMRLCEKVIV